MPVACSTSGTPPRVVTLSVTRSNEFEFALDGSLDGRTADAVVGPVLPAELFSLGGGNPLSVQGNGNLTVDGNAFVNSSTPGAVQMSGSNSRLSVTEDFKILAGGTCAGCDASRVSPFSPRGPIRLPFPIPSDTFPPPTRPECPPGRAREACAPWHLQLETVPER